MQKLLLVSIVFLISFSNVCFALTKSEMRLKEIEKVAIDYESVMLKQVLARIYENIPINQLSGGGEAEQTFRDLLLTEYAKEISKSGSIGVAKSLVKDISKSDAIYQKLLMEEKNDKHN